MSFSQTAWWSTAATVLVVVVFAGCDIPTGTPSVNTETSINTPLVSEKTFSFIGGPKSEFEPLIDTTSSEFDSLFTVGAQSNDISVVQEVDNFDIGSLDDALDEAGGNLAVNNQFSNNLIQNSDLASQSIDARYSESNSEYSSSSASTTASNLADPDNDDAIVVPFPTNLLEVPDFGTVDASGATVKSVTLTGDAGSVNEITFTITNNGSNELDDGNGNPPAIQIEDTGGSSVQDLVTSDFGTKISPGGTASTTVDVSGLSLGENTQYRLIINSDDTGPSNTVELETSLSEWRYQAATLDNAKNNVSIDASRSGISTLGSGASQFKGIDVGSGSITLAIDNQLSFGLTVSKIQLSNSDEPSFGDINDLAIDESFSSSIASGTKATKTVDMAGRGIFEQIDVSVTAEPTNDEITVSADDVLKVSNTGTLNIQTMYFRPDGETIQTSGTVALNNDRITFQDGDYVELGNADVEVNNLTVDPNVTFDTLALSYPDLRRKNVDGQGPDFQPKDSLKIRFVANPSGPFEFDRSRLQGSNNSFTLSFDDENLRIYPSAGDEVAFSIRGKLEDDPNAQAVVNVSDQVTATTSIQKFDIQELDVSGVDPFNVAVTQDSDGDGEIDLANDNEARTASFDGFDSFSDRVEGLELKNVNLDFSVTTRNLASTDAQLYAAIQGRSGTERTFLAGKSGTKRGVTAPLPFQTAFVNDGSPIDAGSLIRMKLDLQDVSPGTEVTRTLPINETNSTVNDFVNSLPSSVRLIGQAEVNTDGGPLQLQKPIEFDAGFTIDVPLQIKNTFTLRDTLDADLSDLKDLTDPEKNLNVSKAELRLEYTNRLPLGADAKLIVVDGAGTTIETFNENFANDKFRIKPAPTDNEGAADGSASGKFVFSLGDTKQDLRRLADGRNIRLELKMTQASEQTAARLRADDTITLDLALDAEATIQTGD